MSTPGSWPVKRLSDVVQEVKGSVTPSAGTDYELWSIPAFATGTPELACGAGVLSAKRPVEPGDVLVSKINPRINRVWEVGPRAQRPQIASLEWVALRPRNRSTIDPAFLRYALMAPAARDWLTGQVSSVTGSHTRVKPARIMAYGLALPSLREQRQIVEIVEDHLSRLDVAAVSLDSAFASVSTWLQLELAHGLRGELIEEPPGKDARTLLPRGVQFVPRDGDRWWPIPPSWTWARLGEVFEVNVGSTPPRADSSAWGGDLPWVSSGEVNFGRIRSTRETIRRSAAGNPESRIHPPGTVMLAMIGEGRTRGQAAILDVEAAHNQNCASIRVSSTRILPEYVFGYFQERYRETRSSAAGGQQLALNKKVIQGFAIPIPPLATQHLLVARWESVREAAARLEAVIASQQQRTATLRQAVLAAAFSGRLSGETVDHNYAAGIQAAAMDLG